MRIGGGDLWRGGTRRGSGLCLAVVSARGTFAAAIHLSERRMRRNGESQLLAAPVGVPGEGDWNVTDSVTRMGENVSKKIAFKVACEANWPRHCHKFLLTMTRTFQLFVYTW